MDEEEIRIWAAADELNRLLIAMDLSSAMAINAAAALYKTALASGLGIGCTDDIKDSILEICCNETTDSIRRSVMKTVGLIQCGPQHIN